MSARLRFTSTSSLEHVVAQNLPSLTNRQAGRPFGLEGTSNCDLLLSNERDTGKDAARRMGHDPRRTWMHSPDVWLPGSSSRAVSAEGRRVRPQHPNDRVSAGDGRVSPASVLHPERR